MIVRLLLFAALALVACNNDDPTPAGTFLNVDGVLYEYDMKGDERVSLEQDSAGRQQYVLQSPTRPDLRLHLQQPPLQGGQLLVVKTLGQMAFNTTFLEYEPGTVQLRTAEAGAVNVELTGEVVVFSFQDLTFIRNGVFDSTAVRITGRVVYER